MGKTSQKKKEKRLAGQVSLALAAGMFSALPVAHGMPTLDPAGTHKDYAETPSVVGNTMSVTGTGTNNVIDWKDFSVKAGETVAFQKVNDLPANYMNIVTGNATSNIEGRITNAGDVYLINPNGVIFGKGAKVDVGNLYVSTREANSVDIAGFKGGTASGESVLSVAASPTTDVVNLIDSTTNGYVRAEKVVMEGRNIRFLDSSSVIQAETGTVNETTGVLTGGTANAESANLVLRSNTFDGTNGYIHVGDASGNYVYTTNKKIGNTPVIGNVGNTGNEKKEKEDRGVVNYALVRDAAGLNSINTTGGNTNSGIGLAGNYMLVDDITNAGAVQIGTADTYGVGNAFTGKFDGMFKTVSGLNQSSNANYLGLFGHTNSYARIENVGVANAKLNGRYAGGIVGYAEGNTTILNVWNAGGSGSYVGTNGGWGLDAGGLVGHLVSSTLKSSYNAGKVNGAGLVSRTNGGMIENCYNAGAATARSNIIYGVVYITADTGTVSTIKNTYSAAKFLNDMAGKEQKGTGGGTYSNFYIIDSDSSYYKDGSTTLTSAKTQTAAAYGSWSISNEGGADTIWRIYEGASLPLLNSFMKAKGTVAAEYSYDKNGVTTQSVNDTSSKVYSATKVAPTDIVLYGANGAAQQATDGTAVKNLTGTQFAASTRKDVYTGSGTTATKFALLYGGQQGYDLYGNNFTITKRSVLFTPGDNPEFTKVYDGTMDATAALASALSGATSGTTGFLAADQQYVTSGKVGFTFSNIDANYTDKNVGTGKTITVSETAGQTASVSLTATDTNYQYIVDNYDVAGNLNDMFGTYESGIITARPVLVNLTTKTGIDKVYDGTSDVTKDGCVGAENLTASGIDGNTASGLVSGDHAMLSATSVYVDASGNETKNVAGTTGAVGVAYKDIVATDTDGNTGNYAFYYKVGENLVAVNDSPLTASGSITPRTLSKDNLVLKDAQGNEMGTTEKPITKTYNGTTTKSLGDGTTAAYASGAIIDNNTDAGKATAKSTETGLLATDAANMTFASTGTVTFYKSDGETQTSFATANGGAQRAGFGVSLTVTDDSILTNYQWSDAPNVELATSVDKVGATGTGVINKSDITVALKQSTGIDKVYDGNANVTGSNTTTGLNYVTGNYEVTSGERYTDATTGSKPELGISGTPTYSDKNVEYDGTTPTAKSIAYTIALSGAAAGNYNLKTATNTTNTTQTVELIASGTITPKELTVTFDDVTKPYDTTADVIGAINPTWDGLVTGDSHTDSAISGKYVAKNATTGNYEEASDVGSYLNDGTKAVMYTGILNALGENAKNYKINGKHYTLSNTEYGRGYITARKISLDQLKSYLDPKGNLTKTYDASADYTHDMVTANQLAASDYLQVDTNAINTAIGAHTLMDGAATDIQAVIDGKLTIASAIYNGVDAGNYTNVSMTFNMDGTGKTQDTGDQKYYITVGNYDFEWAESFSDAASGTPATTGRTGTITPKGLTVTVADATKIYDGTTNVKANGVVFDASNDTFKSWFTFTGMMDNETVTLANGATAMYDNENADAAGSTPTERITYSGLALADGTGKASNYKIVDSQGATINSITGVGTINKRTITLDPGIAARDYNGTATTAANATITDAAFAFTAQNNTPDGDTESDWTVLTRDNGIVDNMGKIIKVGTTGNVIKGEYLATSNNSTLDDGKTGPTTDVAENVRRATDNSVMNKDVAYTGFSDVFDSTNYNLVFTSGTMSNGTLTVSRGGIINPKALNFNTDDITAVAAATKMYDGTKAFSNNAAAEADREKTAKQMLTFKANSDLATYSNVLNVTGEYHSKDVNALDNQQGVTYTITLDPDAGNNYKITGTLIDGQTGLATKTGAGAIVPKKIQAVVNANQAAQEATIVKEYNGKQNQSVSEELNEWVQSNNNNGSPWLKVQDGQTSLVNENDEMETVSLNTSGATVTFNTDGTVTRDANGNVVGHPVTYNDLVLTVTNGNAANYQLVDANGNATTTLAGYGKITPKELTFSTGNDKNYDRSGAATANGVDPASTANVVSAAVTAWQQAGDIYDTDSVTIGQLVGNYGTWTPGTSTFTTNTTGDVVRDDTHETHAASQAILYDNIELTGADADNYMVKTWQKTITVDGTSVDKTVYFDEAIQNGRIKPIALVIGQVSQNWTTADKVYDGTADVKDPKTHLTINYSISQPGESVAPLTGTLDYDLDSAVYQHVADEYADSDAEDNKTLSYTVRLKESTLNNYVLGTDVTDVYGKAGNNGFAKTVTKAAGGNIAKRVLDVSVTDDNAKIYDGTNTVENPENYYVGPSHVTLAEAKNSNTGIVGNDVVSISYTANYTDVNANIDPDATSSDANWNTRDIMYVFTLGGADAKNYSIENKTAKGNIKRREVYVDFATQNDVYQGEGLDKIYDGDASLFTGTNNETSLLASGKSVNDILTLVSATNDTGIVAGEGLTLDTSNVTANYVDADGHASADSDAKLGITTRKVYIQNLNLTGTGNANNYVVKAVKKQGDTQDTNTLEGKGSVAQRQIDFETSTVPTKVYDGTTEVKVSSGGANVTYAGIKEGDADRQLQAGDAYIKLADGVTLAGTETLADVQVSVVSAFYSDKNADTLGGLGVTYKLKWDNQNYELLHTTVDQQGEKVRTLTGTGTITPRTLTYNTGDALTVNKTYDGTPDVKGTSVTSGIFAYAPVDANGKLTTDTGLIQGEDVRLDVIGSYKDDQGNPVSDTGAANNEINGANRTVEVNFEIIGNSNYVLGDSTGPITKNSDTTGTYNGTGRIDRALVKMTPNDATYYVGDAIPSSGYTGTVSGLQNNETLPNGYSFVSDGNAASSVGNYMLLGYVDGKTVAAGANEFTFVDGIGNYYFTTTPNTALHVNARASDVDNGLIADKKFTPDDYSYNRISKDQDLTRLNRESSAAVQYAEKGVNLDGGDTKSGLSALADIQGAGSVVNLEGAFIRTSAPAEQPETVAAEAALPVPETEESDISSISLEYAGDGDNSQALLEILTNASSNAEKKGTSIVIDAQDEDKEDAEEEKSRRAIFADRSNIGIETLGDAVNLNQMIG